MQLTMLLMAAGDGSCVKFNIVFFYFYVIEKDGVVEIHYTYTHIHQYFTLWDYAILCAGLLHCAKGGETDCLTRGVTRVGCWVVGFSFSFLH